MRVVVTGSSSHLAAALLPHLCAHPGVTRVTGIDRRPPRFTHSKFEAHGFDIRDPAVADVMKGHDALVHLAFIVLRGRMAEGEMRDINIDGSRNVFEVAREHGVRRLVHLSSAAVYGSGEALREDAPLKPMPGFLYARHKVQVEAMLAAKFPECARLRPQAILGRNAQPLLKRLLNQPCYVQLREPYPLLQCVHEDDVAHAVLLTLQCDARGPFNLAADDSFSFRDVIRARRRLSLPLPRAVAHAGLRAAWRLFGWGGEPAWIQGLSHTLLLDCSRAMAELGWRPRHSAASMLGSAGGCD